MTAFQGKGYIVVNNSNTIEVVNLTDFTSEATIEGLALPRYIQPVNSTKAYVSQWGADGLTGSVVLVDLERQEVTQTLLNDVGPEAMLRYGNTVYVALAGGYSFNNKIVAIDIPSNVIKAQYLVGDVPQSMVIDENNKLWILCSGINDWADPTNSTSGQLVRFDLVSEQIEQSFDFGNTSAHPTDLVVNGRGDKLYYNYNGGVYAFDVNDQIVQNTPLISGFFYGLGFDPVDDVIYTADAGDFASSGTVSRYKEDGILLNSTSVGIIPGGFEFVD